MTNTTNTMTRNHKMLTLGLVLWALLAASAAAVAAPPAIGPTVDGTLNRITGNVLAMTTSDGRQKFLAFPNDAKVTLDGKACQAAQLKSGTRIRVTIKSTDNSVAIRIEALAKNAKFASVIKDGVVISVTGNKLAMAGPRGEQEFTRTLTRNVKVTCDGKGCTPTDLKPGMRIRVTSQSDDPLAATRVDALDKNRQFPSARHDGIVVSVTGNKLVMTGTQGRDNHECALTADVKVTCDGKVCKPSDLKSGMRIRVTTPSDDPHAAARIEALDKNPTFASL